MNPNTNALLHILYTSHIRGDLDLLPRLHTFLKQMKSAPLDEDEDVMICAVEPVVRRTLLLDLGEACAPEVWHCLATGGRSVLIGLDAMGYAAANVTGLLTSEARVRLGDNLMGMALVDEEHPWQDDDLVVTARQDEPSLPMLLQISLTATETTRLDGNRLRLASVQSGQVGIAHISRAGSNPVVRAAGIFDLPRTTPPDPTIAGTVDFIMSEARLYRQRS